MVLLESIDLKLGSKMPDFTLSDPEGKTYTKADLTGPKGLLTIFTCNHCPYAIAIWPRVIELAKLAKPLGITTIAINPNINPAYPDDSSENMAKKSIEWGIPFPYLVDADQSIANAYQAQCTPDLYLENNHSELTYHGRLDDNWKEPENVTKQELLQAIQHLAQGLPPVEPQYPSMGCSIKWTD